MKLWKMKKSCDFDHEIMNFVEKNEGRVYTNKRKFFRK
jgi:hypothetical protein